MGLNGPLILYHTKNKTHSHVYFSTLGAQALSPAPIQRPSNTSLHVLKIKTIARAFKPSFKKGSDINLPTISSSPAKLIRKSRFDKTLWHLYDARGSFVF